MKRFARLLAGVIAATFVSVAVDAGAQTPFADVRLVDATHSQGLFHNGGFEERAGELVVDPVAKLVRFDTGGTAVFSVSFDRITDLRYEVTKYPPRAFRRPNNFLVLAYTNDEGRLESRVLLLPDARTPSILAALESGTGHRINQGPATTSLLGLPIHLAVGDTVYVERDSGKEIKGQVTEVSPTGFRLASSSQFDLSSIQRIEVTDPVWDGALMGALVAVVPAGLVTLSDCSVSCSSHAGLTAAGWGIVALGFGIGAGIDSSIMRVAYRRTGPSPTHRVLVAPIATSQERSVRVFIRF
jgi:hypothetical protein